MGIITPVLTDMWLLQVAVCETNCCYRSVYIL